MIELMYALTTGILGIFAGAQIAEGILFVPYWKSMKPAEFYKQHKTFGPIIYKFFAPLTIAATLIPIGTTIFALTTDAPGKMAALLTGVFTLLFFATYFMYFKKANKSFEEASLSEEELPLELIKWGKWHWTRIYLELAALICALVAVTQI
ncbi:MAG: Ca2+/Na+ antiporter [Saprospiraceae bacterium]|jgi:Ca2+/Na+ antiporter